jgi:hypothetical protein
MYIFIIIMLSRYRTEPDDLYDTAGYLKNVIYFMFIEPKENQIKYY